MNRILISFVILLLVLCCHAQAKERIELTNGEWEPYLSKQLPHYGAASKIVTEAFAAVGVEVRYSFYPWKRSYKLAKEGTAGGTLVWVFTEERAKDFLYSDVVIQEFEYLFHLKERPIIWNKIEDLRGLTIGATLHTVYPPLEAAAKAGILKLERAGNYDNLYRRLLSHRIDAIPQVSQVGRQYLHATLPASDRQRITFSKTILQQRAYHLILSKQRPENQRYMELFNKGLATIRQNGKYNKIIESLEDGFYFRKKD